MKSIVVSVIVPVYNAEQTINRCLDSMVKQTIFDKMEIILVNDGSKDRSSDIINEYSKAYPDQIIVINQKNSGPGAARNNGLRRAKGRYIGFVDADDYVEPEMYETMLEGMTGDIAMVMCGRFNTYENGEVLIKYNNPEYNGTSINNNPKLLSRISTFVWDKLYKKDIIENNGILFSEKYHYAEDFCFLETYILMGGRVAVVDKPLYHYHLGTPGSITGSCNMKWLDIISVLEEINESCIAQGIFEKYKNELLYSSAGFYCRRVRTLKQHKNKIMQMIFVAKFHIFFKRYYNEKWKKVVKKHKVEEARNERTNIIKMVFYILKK